MRQERVVTNMGYLPMQARTACCKAVPSYSVSMQAPDRQVNLGASFMTVFDEYVSLQ